MKCSANCDFCSADGTCTKDNVSSEYASYLHFLFLVQNHQVFSLSPLLLQCSSGYGLNSSNQCVKCTPNCMRCDGNTPSVCEYCVCGDTSGPCFHLTQDKKCTSCVACNSIRDVRNCCADMSDDYEDQIGTKVEPIFELNY